jgi:WhiB family transcriptional regulator, redox-sensing transcriptional regulator
VRSRPAWMLEAACVGVDTRIFFPEAGGAAETATALGICRRCPVRGPCRAYGAQEAHGIWGGQTVNGRRRPHRSKKVA